jgi:polar amino acid transport system permease protein
MDVIQTMLSWMPSLLKATWTTISLTIVSVSCGLVISIFLALGKISKSAILQKISGAYIFFFRGTPLLMQLFFIYYALPLIWESLTIQSRFAAALGCLLAQFRRVSGGDHPRGYSVYRQGPA